MQENKDILDVMYETVSMEVSSIDTILPKVNNIRLRNELEGERARCGEDCEKIAKKISAVGRKPKDASAVTKAFADISINMSTLADNSDSHIAEMMIQGTNMGIIELKRAINENSESEHRGDARKMMNRSEDYVDRLKNFL